MMTCHELLGFMSPDLAQEILVFTFNEDKPLYRTTLAAVASARKLRPVFYERKPKNERHQDMLEMLSRPRMEPAAAELLRGWLMKSQTGMLADFMDALEIPHRQGVVDSFPASVEDGKLAAGVEKLLSKYPREKVVVYLHGFCGMNAANWKNLEDLLQKDTRLQLG
jgi:hypothetical protein